jgi:hypothetical protein
MTSEQRKQFLKARKERQKNRQGQQQGNQGQQGNGQVQVNAQQAQSQQSGGQNGSQGGAPSQNQGGTPQTPSLRSIMSSQMRPAPQGNNDGPAPGMVLTDSSGQRFVITALQRKLRVNNINVEANENMMLIDGGSNNGMAGAGMHLLETPVLDQKVDIVGATDNVDIEGLSMGTYGAVCTTSHGEQILTMWPQLVGYGMGKSICSMSQGEAYGLDICDRAHK